MNDSQRTPAEVQEILDLKNQIEPKLNEKDRGQLERLESSNGVGTDPYLNEVVRLYKKYMLGVFEAKERKPDRGFGGRKPGSHREGAHR